MADKVKKEKTKTAVVSFKCKFCEKSKPIDQMVVLNRFFPPVVVCRDCEKRLQ